MELKINTQVMPRRGSFKYFGSIIQENQEIDNDVARRIGAMVDEIEAREGVV